MNYGRLTSHQHHTDHAKNKEVNNYPPRSLNRFRLPLRLSECVLVPFTLAPEFQLPFEIPIPP